MNLRVLKSLLAPLFFLALTLGFAAQSYAADTWRPQFVSGQHVYLDPLLQRGDHPVNLSGLESQLKAEGKKDGVEYFVVMTLKGDETTPGSSFAQTREREVMGQWNAATGFPVSNAVFIYVVRLNTDWTKSAVATYVAPALHQRGLDHDPVWAIADGLSQHRTDNPNALLPNDPKGFFLGVAEGSGKLISDHDAELAAQARQAEADRLAAIAAAKRNHAIAVGFEVGTPIVLILIALAFLYFRKRKAVAAAKTVIDKWDGLFQTANSNYIQLDGEYLDFLKKQGANWKDRFKGITLQRYTAAIGAYADLAVRIRLASQLLDAAKKANDTGNIFSLAGNEHALALLTTEDVTIDSKALPFEQQGLFGALLDGKANTKKPDELLQDMDSLFKTTNSTMAQIMAAFEGSTKNKTEIEAQFAAVEALKANLTATGLSFDAYQPSFDKLSTAEKAFLAIVDSDPLEAFEESKVVEADCEALTAKIGHAIELRKSLSTTDEAIKKASARIAEVRGQAADYNYPDGGAPAAGAATNYLLNEVGSNPDDSLNAAKAQLSDAITFVVAGKLDQSKAAKSEAEAHAADAIDTVGKVLAAKELVQKQVPVVHGALDKLKAEIPGGDEALASLNASFLPKNFDSAPGQVKTAKAVQDSTSGQLAAVKAAFFEQRYVAAAALVTTVTGDIQGSRNGIIAVHTRLKDLTALRQHSKDQTAANTQTAIALNSKIAAAAFTTALQTDGQFRALSPVLSFQQQDVAKSVTDWPVAAAAADDLAGKLEAIDNAIDAQKHAYDHAVSTLASLRQAVASAEAEGDSNIVRSQAKSLISQAEDVLRQAEGDIKVARSDWDSLSRRFDTSIKTANSARSAAQADKTAYNEAVAAINDAAQYARSVESGDYSTYRSIGGSYSGTFGRGISADCSSAQSYIARANQLLSSQRYEDAEREAGNARSAAAQAKANAEAQVQQAIAIAVAAWEEEEAERRREEQRRRDAEAEAQRQRDEESRRNSDNSGGGFGGGGFSGGSNDNGGGFSGGGNDNGGGFS